LPPVVGWNEKASSCADGGLKDIIELHQLIPHYFLGVSLKQIDRRIKWIQILINSRVHILLENATDHPKLFNSCDNANQLFLMIESRFSLDITPQSKAHFVETQEAVEVFWGFDVSQEELANLDAAEDVI
jgi:hypothetical protein